MKVNELAIIVSNKKGTCYEVMLTKGEKDIVIGLLAQMQGGAIKIHRKELGLELRKSI